MGALGAREVRLTAETTRVMLVGSGAVAPVR
jgi:hypothetical protein